jgi:hypothetical protein
MTASGLREVYSAANIQEAQLLSAALEEAGIESRVVEDRLLNAVPSLPAASVAPRIWVRAEDVDRARIVVEEALARHQAEGTSKSDWECAACGEKNGPSFDICWSCQADRSMKE